MKKKLILINSLDDIVAMFSHDANSIEQYVKYATQDVLQRLDTVIAIAAEKRTWQNTPNKFSEIEASSDLIIFKQILVSLNKLSQNQSICAAARITLKKIEDFFVDMHMRQDLYRAFMEYVDGPMQHEKLSDEQLYYITEKVKEFKRLGLDLPGEKQEEIKACHKDIGKKCLQFTQNIAQDQSFVLAHPSELTGLDQDFIDALKKDEDKVILGVDYPTYFKVQAHCSNGEIRKKLYFAFQNRAHPENEKILYEMIALRDRLAKLLGFKSYANYELEDEMVRSVDAAEQFLANFLKCVNKKEAKEYTLLCEHLPEGVNLNEDGTLNPWDVGFIKETYRNNFYNLDQNMLAEYFPMENVISGLFSIYEQLFGLKMQQVPISGLWSDEVRAIEVIDIESDHKLGYILLDLHPRPLRYSHACVEPVVPATVHSGKITTNVSIVMANLPRPVGKKSSLLRPDDVQSFLFGFGLAIYNILGRQEIASVAGMRVKHEFIIMPSQILQEWLWSRDIIKMLSHHYQTGESLANETIDTMITMKKIFNGSFLQELTAKSFFALNSFKDGIEKDIPQLWKQMHNLCRSHIAYHSDSPSYSAFRHLCNGARYYRYLRAMVFTADILHEIKKHGLLNASIGKKYRDLVIGKGGSKDPNELLRDFLGREPNSDAFFSDLGI